MRVDVSAPDVTALFESAMHDAYPDARGRFGPFGGRYVPETLIPALDRLESGMRQHLHSADFQAELTHELKTWAGRPTALTHATRLSKSWVHYGV